MGRSAVVALITLATSAANAGDRPSLRVRNASELYEAVNNPANAGTEIVMDPGLYALAPCCDRNGQLWPNAGRLELPPGAALRGHNRYPGGDASAAGPDLAAGVAHPQTETVIDAAGLPPGSFVIPVGPGDNAVVGVLRIGRDNEVSRITMRNAVAADSLVAIDLMPAIGGLRARVSRCVLEGASVSIGYRHFLANGAGRDSQVVIEDNFLGNNAGLGSFGMGIRMIINRRVTAGSILRLRLRRNLIYNNTAGLHAQAEGSSDQRIEIDSADNVFVGNGTGLGVEGITARNNRSDGNGITLSSRRDTFIDTSGAVFGPFQVRGGIVTRAAVWPLGTTRPTNDNTARVHVSRALFSGERLGADVALYGAFGVGGTFAGLRNVANVVICDTELDRVDAIDAQPADPPEIPDGDRNRAILGASELAIHCPADVTWVAPSPDGVAIELPRPIVDSCAAGETTLSPASGSWFPPGTTAVTALASDGTGTVTCSFNVTVVVAPLE